MAFDEAPLPAPPKLPKNAIEKDKYRRLIVVLDKASLELTRISSLPSRDPTKSSKKTFTKYALLNGDEHQNILKKSNRDASQIRPDITHQCLLTLLDSPLNKAGLLQIYIRTQKGVLIEVNPQTRIPRTFARFSGLMVQLLHKLSVRSSTGDNDKGVGERLLNVIKNPIDNHLPIRHTKIGMSSEGPLVKIREFVRGLPSDKSTVIWIGAMAHGEDTFDGVEEEHRVSISQYPLSASVTCGKLCDAFEELWEII